MTRAAFSCEKNAGACSRCCATRTAGACGSATAAATSSYSVGSDQYK